MCLYELLENPCFQFVAMIDILGSFTGIPYAVVGAVVILNYHSCLKFDVRVITCVTESYLLGCTSWTSLFESLIFFATEITFGY